MSHRHDHSAARGAAGAAAAGTPGRGPAPGPAPTTRAQVSGHRFLTRRLRHGLVFGDIRMIHDPLARRRRAGLIGAAAAGLVAAGAGLLAVIDPAPDPGEAAVLRAESGALFVRVDETVHPVANLASARLIAGGPEEPAEASPDALSARPLGRPVGIPGAPGTVAEEAPAPEARWAACVAPDGAVTVALTAPRPLDDAAGLIARPRAAGARSGTVRDWLVTAEGRRALPEEGTADGDRVRAALGVDQATRVWRPPTEVLAAAPELPELTAADLDAAGTDGVGALELADPTDAEVCTGGPDAALSLHTARPYGTAVELPGEGTAERFAGPGAGAFAVDTGHGVQVVSDNGMRHRLPDPEAAAVLGLPEPHPGWWPVLRLLPEGAALSVEAALEVEDPVRP